MEYFILNEYSLPTTRIQEDCLRDFFDIYLTASQSKFKEIRVSDNIDAHWYEIPITKGRTIRNWIREQQNDYKIRLKSLISSTTTPVFSVKDIEEKSRFELSNFYYENSTVPILGATYLLKQLALSFNTEKKWNKSKLNLKHDELTEDGEIISVEIFVENVATIEHWKLHFNEIEKLRKEILLPKNFTSTFDHIIFTDSALKDLKKIHSPTFLKEIWDCFNILNKIINLEKDNITISTLSKNTTINISDESDTVKNNPKLQRHRMKLYKGERHFFGFHIKNFAFFNRVHFIIDHDDNKIVIGYIGKHLPH